METVCLLPLACDTSEDSAQDANKLMVNLNNWDQLTTQRLDSGPSGADSLVATDDVTMMSHDDYDVHRGSLWPLHRHSVDELPAGRRSEHTTRAKRWTQTLIWVHLLKTRLRPETTTTGAEAAAVKTLRVRGWVSFQPLVLELHALSASASSDDPWCKCVCVLTLLSSTVLMVCVCVFQRQTSPSASIVAPPTCPGTTPSMTSPGIRSLKWQVSARRPGLWLLPETPLYTEMYFNISEADPLCVSVCVCVSVSVCVCRWWQLWQEGDSV